MRLRNRIKQAAAIDVGGLIILGTAEAGFEAVTPKVSDGSSPNAFPYLLTSVDGTYEYGFYEDEGAGDPETRQVLPRIVWDSNHPGGSFPAGTSGLTLSIPSLAHMSVFVSPGGTGGTPPALSGLQNTVAGVGSSAQGTDCTVYGFGAVSGAGGNRNTAAGAGAMTQEGKNGNTVVGYMASAGDSFQVALGESASAVFPGETVIGGSVRPNVAHVPLTGAFSTGAGATTPLHFIDPTTPWDGGLVMSALLTGQRTGAAVLTGYVSLWTTLGDASTLRIYKVEITGSVDSTGAWATLGTPSVTEVSAGTSPVEAALSFSGGELVITGSAASAGTGTAQGLLTIHRLVFDTSDRKSVV